jgi:mRNA interferase MazF
MIGFEFGDVVLVPLPFTDQSTTKQRPAVVISSDPYHRERPDVLLLAVTSQQRPASGVGEVAIRHWKESGLLRPSVFKPLVATLERRRVQRKLGRLADEDRRALRGVLDAIFGR